MHIQSPLHRLFWHSPSARRNTTRIGVLLFGAVLCAGFLLFPFRKPDHSAYKAQARTLCLNMFGMCDSVSMPHFWEKTCVLPDGTQEKRRFWSVTCLVQGRQFVLSFHAKENRLYSVLGESRGRKSRWNEIAPLPIETPQQAFEMSVLRLRQLGLLPQGAVFKLEKMPALQHNDSEWEVVWRVQRTPQSEPSRLRLMLDRLGGAPVNILDTFGM
jgi:hypothetical protein